MPSSLQHSPSETATSPADSRYSGRANNRQQPLELCLVIMVALNLCFLPWAFGGVDPWSQFTSAGLSFGALTIALLPRPSRGMAAGGHDFHMPGWPRLRKFPVFWAGLALFAYMGLQALNPAYEYHLAGSDWWLTKLAHIPWLPAGMKVPFEEMNPWRTILIWSSCWATVCALWAGLTRRRSIRWLLTALSVNAFAFASFGIIQRASGTSEIYGMRPVGFPYFFAAIIYKNHAAAFFGLLTAVTLGVLIRAFWQSCERPGRSSPAILYLLFTLILILAVVLSYSFSGAVLLGLMLALVTPITIWRFAKAFPRSQGLVAFPLTAGLLLVLTLALGATVGNGGIQKKIQGMRDGAGYHSARTRLLAARSGFEMLKDRWATGWGAGCFRYGFTKYQHEVPELTQWRRLRLSWEHVHNDWLELLIELGVIGVLPVAGMIVYWLRQIIRLRLWRNPAVCPILCGLAMLSVHAFLDFPFQNPAVAGTACALLPLSIRWGEIENQAQSRSVPP